MSSVLVPSPVAAPPSVHARGAQAYYQTHVQSRTPVEVVVMLYDGAIRYLQQASRALAEGDLVTKRDALSRGMTIVSELQGMLNLEQGGEIARRLDGLYTYVHGCCLEANTQRKPEKLDEAVRLLGTLRSAWAELAGSPPSVA
jgi:flagellar protein FliS